MHRHRRPTAFTLIEVLVAIGIIVLLVGLVLPLLVKARKSAAKSRMTADLALIGTALEAYKLDFHDYPRFTLLNSTDELGATANGNGKWLDNRTDRGAVLLCRCLLGPGPAGSVTQTYASPGDDGADGLGFRANRNVTAYGGATTDKFTGPVSGPYIQSEKFPVGGTKDADNYQDAVLLDSVGNPILYYPALPTHGPLTGTGAFVATASPVTTGANTQLPLYNAFDNSASPTSMATYMPEAELKYILGQRASTTALSAGETPATSAPYLLWTAGPDGIYGRGPNGKSDDVANLDLPVDLVK